MMTRRKFLRRWEDLSNTDEIKKWVIMIEKSKILFQKRKKSKEKEKDRCFWKRGESLDIARACQRVLTLISGCNR